MNWMVLLSILVVSTPNWVKMPLLPLSAAKAEVRIGGEGSQWPRGPIAVSPADPDFLLLPIDVGGLYRSLDGGRTWEISMVGWDARGANGFGIDPKNASRVIGIAANSMNWNEGWGASPHGLYLSTDKAASWKHVLATTEAFGGQIEFDPRSFDSVKNYCAVVYYLSSGHGLLRSSDGESTWSRLPAAPDPGLHKNGDWSEGLQTAPRLAVDQHSGVVYLGGANGLLCSTDQGQTWERLHSDAVYSLALAPSGKVFISRYSDE